MYCGIQNKGGSKMVESVNFWTCDVCGETVKTNVGCIPQNWRREGGSTMNTVKGYYTPAGYMGWIGGGYVLFASESDYLECVKDVT